jgi:hypothetical protein
VPRSLIEPAPANLSSLTFDLLFALLDVAATAVAKPSDGASPAQVTQRLLAEHPQATMNAASGALTLPPVNAAAAAGSRSIAQLGATLAQQTGVSGVTVRKQGNSITVIGSVNPDVTLGEAELPNLVEQLKNMFKGGSAWFTRDSIKSKTFTVGTQSGTLTDSQIDKLLDKARGELVEGPTIAEEEGQDARKFYAFAAEAANKYGKNQERLSKMGEKRFTEELAPKWATDLIDSPSSDIRNPATGKNAFKEGNLSFAGEPLPPAAADELKKDALTTAQPMGKTALETSLSTAREAFQRAAAGTISGAPVLNKALPIAQAAQLASATISKIEYVDDGRQGKISVPGKAEAEIKLQQAYAAVSRGSIPQVLSFLMAMARDSKPGNLSRAEFLGMWNDDTPTRTANREFIGDKLRGLKEQPHEWIPCEITDRVVLRASTAPDDGTDASELAKWIHLQNNVRSKTFHVIFSNDTAPYRVLPDPERDGAEAIIPHGHSGAVYGPRAGATLIEMRRANPELVAVTEAQDDFHKKLHTIFDENKESFDKLKAAMGQLIPPMLWDGGGTIHSLARHRSPTGERLTLKHGTDAKTQVEKDLTECFNVTVDG